MPKFKSLTIAAFCLTTACNSAPMLSPGIPPSNMIAPCASIPDTRPKDLGELLEADIELIGLYRECSARHAALAEWATKR